jgi:hypothetical protein
MNTHNTSKTSALSTELINTPNNSANSSPKLEVLTGKVKARGFMLKKTSYRPSKLKPAHSMTGLRSLKPSKIVTE